MSHVTLGSPDRSGIEPTEPNSPFYEEWMDRAACVETDPDLFFPEKNASTFAAKRVCASCDVREQCLAFALRNDESHGIFGGLSGNERRRLKKGRTTRLPVNLDETISDLNGQGYSDGQISLITGVPRSTISLHRRDLGIPAVPLSRKGMKP